MLFLYLIVSYITVVVNTEEYCNHEFFTPECKAGEAIVMKNAYYGRMKTGKCLKIAEDSPSRGDTKYFGCKTDVLDFMDRNCSGLTKCSILVANPELMKRSSCHQDLMHYLNAEYFCLPVVGLEKTCNILTNGKTNLVVDDNISKSNLCGELKTKLLINAPEGQTINTSLLVFKSDSNNSSTSLQITKTTSKHGCHGGMNGNLLLGKIIDPSDINRHVFMCQNDGRRGPIHVSKGNKLEIEINKKSGARFMLIFTATGCYDLKPPKDAWMKREGNDITIGCYTNRHTWKLVCIGVNWVGVIGNCSKYSLDHDTDDYNEAPTLSKPNEQSRVFLYTVSASCIVLISIFSICLFLFKLQSFKISKAQNGRKTFFHPIDIQSINNINYNHNGSISRSDPSSKCAKNENLHSYMELEVDESQKYYVLDKKSEK